MQAQPRSRVSIRDASEQDLEAIQAIYGHYVLSSLATFEEVPPSVEQMRARRDNVLVHGLPYLVAECDGAVVGFSYATAYRPATGLSLHGRGFRLLAPEYHGRGIGCALLAELVGRCSEGPWRQMVAVIGDSANMASLRLHERLGFRAVGTLDAVGFKMGRWVDTVLMQRPLPA